MHSNPFVAEEHLFRFSEFCKYVRLAGGATPHLVMVWGAARNCPPAERLWRGGCYAATYNYPAAEAIWRSWGPDTVRSAGILPMTEWLREHWKAIPLRKERKAVRTPEKLAECLVSFAWWAESALDHPAFAIDFQMDPAARYEMAWDDFGDVRYMGRYITIRFLEFMRRAFGLPLVMPDIRPVGGEFPRQALNLMFPASEWALLGGNGTAELAEVNRVSDECIVRLADGYGVVVDHYTLQSLLCEYKQSVLGQRQYPGRSVDSELGYWRKVYGGENGFSALRGGTEFWNVRRELFPWQALGEDPRNQWDGARDDLGKVLVNFRYTWSDVLYDYSLSKDHLVDPVRR